MTTPCRQGQDDWGRISDDVVPIAQREAGPGADVRGQTHPPAGSCGGAGQRGRVWTGDLNSGQGAVRGEEKEVETIAEST
jgi:hypothetical protein